MLFSESCCCIGYATDQISLLPSNTLKKIPPHHASSEAGKNITVNKRDQYYSCGSLLFPKFFSMFTCEACFDRYTVRVCFCIWAGHCMGSPSPWQAHVGVWVLSLAIAILPTINYCLLITSVTHIHGCAHCICKAPLRSIIHIQSLEKLLSITQNCHPIPISSKVKLLQFKYLKSFAHEPQPTGLHSQNISHGKNINNAYFLKGLQKRWWS